MTNTNSNVPDNASIPEEEQTQEQKEAVRLRLVEVRKAAQKKNIELFGPFTPKKEVSTYVFSQRELAYTNAADGQLSLDNAHFNYLHTKLLECHGHILKQTATDYERYLFIMIKKLMAASRLNRDGVWDELECMNSQINSEAFAQAWTDVCRFAIDGPIPQ